ncbi:MAG: phytoene/squalene synthase family protein [Acidobacteriota bacterium]|nr:phytoene/squalene synthase family protein [Acidobacteriota bacterium]
MTLAEAYLECRAIARREAKNFYYSFLALPKAKSDAMCAVYAFMRRADDISDDEQYTIEQRRQQMRAWLDEWHAVEAGGPTSNPVFLAVRDTQQRFGITSQLLDQLVQGTTMDLDRHDDAAGTVQTYATFQDLYQYCYLVASVVGLVCIRIFGYRDPAAEKLAEETGIAFQLTNILRDVKEDAERGRIYLPQDLLAESGVDTARVQALAAGAAPSAIDRAMLRSLAARAEQYYGSAQRLLPLIDADSRAAMWVLVTIYHELLVLIERADGDVFSTRLSVPTRRKVSVLMQGMVMGLWKRMVA